MPFNSDQPGRIIAIVGSAPDAGTTMIAVSLAVALQQTTGEATALVDLDIRSGDCHKHLSASPIVQEEALAVSDESDVALAGAMVTHHSGLHLLCAATITRSKSTAPAPGRDVSQGNSVVANALRSIRDAIEPKSPPSDFDIPRLEHMMNWLASRYRYLVFDIPAYTLPAAHSVLLQAGNVVVIGNLYDLTTIVEMRAVIANIRKLPVAREKVKVILNRLTLQNRLPLAEIEQTLGCNIAAQIPNDSRLVPESIRSGIPPVLSDPDAAVSLAIVQFATSIR